MGPFDKLKGKKDDIDKKSEYELRREIFEATKNAKVDMKFVEQEAIKNPDRMIFQDVKNPEEFKWRNWALHFSMNGEYEKAIEYCDKGIEINPKSAYLFYVRGRSKGDVEQLIEGIEDLNEAIKIKPSFADAFVERGYIKQKIGDTMGAEEDYKRAKEIEPSIVLPECVNMSFLEEYCKYCGEDNENGHSEQCPLVYGLNVSQEGYLGYGFKVKKDDPELNLHMGRELILLTWNGEGLGPKDKKIAQRLAYESTKFYLERIDFNIENLASENSNPLKRMLIRRKLNKLIKEKKKVREYSEARLPQEKIRELFNEIEHDS